MCGRRWKPYKYKAHFLYLPADLPYTAPESFMDAASSTLASVRSCERPHRFTVYKSCPHAVSLEVSERVVVNIKRHPEVNTSMQPYRYVQLPINNVGNMTFSCLVGGKEKQITPAISTLHKPT